MAKHTNRRTDELASYLAFQQAVFEGAQKAARLDAEPEPAFIPYGRCPRHPGVSTFEHGFDVPCNLCEAEMDEQAEADPDWQGGRCRECGEFMGDYGCVTIGCAAYEEGR